jgi:hypothetical protein
MTSGKIKRIGTDKFYVVETDHNFNKVDVFNLNDDGVQGDIIWGGETWDTFRGQWKKYKKDGNINGKEVPGRKAGFYYTNPVYHRPGPNGGVVVSFTWVSGRTRGNWYIFVELMDDNTVNPSHDPDPGWSLVFWNCVGIKPISGQPAESVPWEGPLPINMPPIPKLWKIN